MHRIEDRIREKATMPQQTPRLTALSWTSAIALLANALVYAFQFFFLWLALGILIIPVLVFSIITLIASALVFARVRWAPLIGACVALVTTVILLIVPGTTAVLTHPADDPGHFGTVIADLAAAFVALIAGVAAAGKGYRRK